jgi:tetraacyldisaccharide 4'-kinase
MTPFQAPQASLRARAEAVLLRVWFGTRWYQRLSALLLSPLAWVTARVSESRRARIRALARPHPPVVVVGNLVVGGAGKTPLVMALAQALEQRGLRVGIVCGGYRGTRSDPRLVQAQSNPKEHGDEAVVLARAHHGPVAAGRDRAAALAALTRSAPALDVVLSDDGLQHVSLQRSVEIAVFDSRGVGNGRYLPAGPLRESVAHISEMDAVALNEGARSPAGARRTFGFRIEPRLFTSLRGDAEPIHATDFARFAGRGRVVALAGMGNPQRFFDTLANLGIEARGLPLGDHANFGPELIAAIEADLIVMTTKDAVKCETFADSRCWSLEVSALPDPALIDWLIEALRGPSPA